MARWYSYCVAVFAVFAAGVSTEAMAADAEEEAIPRVTALLTGHPVSHLVTGGTARPKLYDNTSRCTVNVKALAVGGSTSPTPALSLLDYFVTDGGSISGFDLYLLNGGADPSVGGGPQPISEFKFYEGSDATGIGTAIPGALFRTIPQSGAPFLSSVPVHVDPVTGEPRVIKVSVDYTARTYNVTDAETGVPLNDGFSGEPIVDQDIGNRPIITLPPGKAGVLLRLGAEHSICALGDPKAGPVLAGGGAGAEDGLWIINATLCAEGQLPDLCDNPGWDGTTPCTGGNVCSLDRPFFGIMMTLYMGPSEDSDGNNSTATADTILVGSPSPCTSDLVTVHGYVGDNGQPSAIQNAPCFDGVPTPGGDGEIDLLDWGMLQTCFGPGAGPECNVFDSSGDGDVGLDDFATFQQCLGSPGLPQCSTCTGEGPPVLLADVDIYRIPNVSRGDVYEILVEGTKSPVVGSLWDPFLRVWGQTFAGIDLLETSDNFGRVNKDAFTTVEIPQGVNTLYVGVSTSFNSQYEPDDPTSIGSLCPEGEPDPLKQCADRAGGYSLTVGVVDPECVVDDGSTSNSCDNPSDPRLRTRHEPDDSMADADERDPDGISSFVLRGVVGDGSFAEYGQDVDIYKIVLDGPRANNRSLTAKVTGITGGGFDTVFDLVMGLYDSQGVLLATGDQKSTASQGRDQSRPQLAAEVCGTGVADCNLEFGEGQTQDGTYYLAIFGTDRGVFNDNCDPIFPETPPSILNFPHDPNVARTQNTDLRPTVGGRVNLPGAPLEGPNPLNCDLDPVTMQCYKIFITSSDAGLANQQGFDDCEGRFVSGSVETDDSVFDACTVAGVGTRLSSAPINRFWLGNGPYGGWQGDVDFHRVSVPPGSLISVSIADMEQPPVNDHPVRSYLAFYDGCGNILATHDYSLERANDDMFDGVSDEIAANIAMVAPTVPIEPCSNPASSDMYVMVGIDNGNLVMEENTPFDAAHPGTTLSRRFEQDILVQRQYAMAITVLDPVGSVNPSLRMFATPTRGLDANHVSCFLRGSNPNNGSRSCWPSILEIDPTTGQAINILDGLDFFVTRRNAQGTADFRADEFVSANPLIAYDGQFLWVALEQCRPGVEFCRDLDHLLFKMDPNALPEEFGYITNLGFIEGFDSRNSDTSTGMVEVNGFLYILDAQNNETCQMNGDCYSLRWWDKTLLPTGGNGGTTVDLTELSGEGPDPADEFDAVFGDLATDGTNIYMACSFEGVSVGICSFTHDPTLNIVQFNGIIGDPITNVEDTDNDNIPDLTPGPRLGGFDFIGSDKIVASDRNGRVLEYWNMTTDTVTGALLPREFVIRRISARLESD